MLQNNSNQSNQSETELNFFDILRILLNSKHLIIIVTAIITVFGYIYAHSANSNTPIKYEAFAVMEIGSYPATSEAEDRNGKVLIASMEATTTLLNAIYGMGKVDQQINKNITYIFRNDNKYDENLKSIRIYELDSQYFIIEVFGSASDIVKNKTLEIVEYIKTIHLERMNEILSQKERELKSVEDKLKTIDNFISDVGQDGEIEIEYMADVTMLKLKELDYRHELKEHNIDFSNIKVFRKTDLVKDIQFYTDYPTSSTVKITLSILIIGFILSAIFVLLRHTLAINYKK